MNRVLVLGSELPSASPGGSRRPAGRARVGTRPDVEARPRRRHRGVDAEAEAGNYDPQSGSIGQAFQFLDAAVSSRSIFDAGSDAVNSPPRNAAVADAAADALVLTQHWSDLVDDAEAARLAAESAEEVTDQLATMIDADGSGGYQFTSLSLAHVPAGDSSEIIVGVLAGLGSDRIIRLGPGYNPSTGSWTLIKGNDHVHELGGHVDFTLDLPGVDLASATAKVGAKSKNRGQFDGVASIVSSGGGYVLRIEWPKANLSAACPGDDYVVHAKVVTQDGSLELTKASGPLTLHEDATEPGS